MKLKDIINQRYTVKKFDTSKKINDELLQEIKDLLRLSPSSTNIQPWKFTIVSTEAGKAKIAKSTENFGFNTEKIVEASNVVVFSTKNKIDEAYLNTVLEQEDQDGRFPQAQFKEEMDWGRKFFLNKNIDEGNGENWLSSQVYLNAGHFVLGAKALGIDSVIMEGFDKAILDEELELNKDNYTSTLIIAIGYGDNEDFNMHLNKSRLSEELIIDEI